MVELIEQNFLENKNKYNKVEQDLRKLLGKEPPISHVGSTAIPDMFGKNIIDVLVGAKNEMQFELFKKTIIDYGFFASKNSVSEIYQFLASKEGETGAGDIHIHLVMLNIERYDEFIILRNYLLANKQEALNYSNHKKQLIKNGVVIRKDYKKIKSIYVSKLIERAKNYFAK